MRKNIKPTIIICLALVLSGILFGCSTAHRSTTVGQTNTLPNLYVHFGVASRDPANRLLSARINLGEAFFVGGDDFDELKGHIEQRGTNLVADLMGSTGQEGQFYRGNMTLEKPFFGQGGAASGGMGVMWFAISTNSDCETILEHVNAVMGFTNAPFSHPDAASSPPVISSAPKDIDPATGLPWGNLLVDPTTGLPSKHNKQP
jgi:hypothetical protein